MSVVDVTHSGVVRRLPQRAMPQTAIARLISGGMACSPWQHETACERSNVLCNAGDGEHWETGIRTWRLRERGDDGGNAPKDGNDDHHRQTERPYVVLSTAVRFRHFGRTDDGHDCPDEVGNEQGNQAANACEGAQKREPSQRIHAPPGVCAAEGRHHFFMG
eukprot:1219963-Rhodomonas_salina.2